ncbi:hypothetical protein COV04_02890 [Candidatus Uhrbacteria bacterium CG10_big_fil_rev_8_21_14_0_10_48_11]|uniref:Uncharacterized protein n=1 Tax=Candidatus Uhrbacteria bacterium CG10_big_fil_rev_8_21_14_0_10_48_11 TaxID=1975037 RepID=A0A2M8LEQ5_9BACT|nr:MAG: hypothetical protein COV04_02890 [Candidatus Uhrbacteria bacterium CG10_big_fil_rev_8_21_14_0_10_48_11]
MSNIIKRGVSIAVTATTILWSIGAGFAPLATRAASAGDLIKMDGSTSVYYLGTDGLRYVFPNSKTYFTWYSDFSSVVTVSQSEMQSYHIKGNITYRPGTRLVKITTDPHVYAVEPGGTLRWIENESIATTLYGSNWASLVDDVPDEFFVNYTLGSSISTNSYPTGSLIKQASSNDVYYVDGSSKRMVTAAGFTANKFQSKDVLVADDSVFNALSTGSQINSADTSIWNLTGGASTSTPGGSGLTVALAADTAAPGIQAAGTAYNKSTKLNLTASADGSVNVTGIVLTRQGLSQDSTFSGVGIYDATGRRYGNVVTFGDTKANVLFPNDPLVVPAGQTVSVWAKTNIAASTSLSGTYAIAVLSAADVKTTATVSGSFPVSGNGFSLIPTSGSVATVTITSQTLAGGTSTSPTQIDQGSTNLDVQKFRIAETTGQEGATLNHLTVFNNGSAADGDYTNIRLKDQNGNVLATVATATSGKVNFDLSASPYTIPKGTQRDFTLSVDVPGVSNSAGRTLDFTVQNDYDLEIYGTSTGSGILPTAAGSSTFPIGDGSGADVGNYVQFKTGSMIISRSSDSPSAKVAPGATNVLLASFDVKAFGEDIEVQKLTWQITSDGSTALANGSTCLTGTVKINNGNDSTVYTSSATGATIYYSTPGTASCSTTLTTGTGSGVAGTQQTLNTYYTVKAGTTGKLKFYVDINSAAVSTDSYAVRITGFYARRVSTNNYITDTSTVTGIQRQVDTSSLTISSNSSYNPTNLVKGGSNLKIGSFNVQAGAAEGVNLTTMGVLIGTNNGTSTAAAVFTTAAVPTGISNVNLKIGETAFGTPISSVTAGSTDSFSGNAVVPASGTVQVDVYADVSTAFNPYTSGSDILSTKLSVTAGVGQSSQTTKTATATQGQSITMTANGTLLLQSDAAGTPIQQVVTASQIDVPLLTLKVSENTNAEDLTLNKLYLAFTNGSGNYQDVKLFNGSTQVGSTAQIVSGEVRFTGLGFVVVKSDSAKVLTVKATATGSGVQTPGQQTFVAPTYFEYVGNSSGTTVRASGGVTSATSSASTTLTVNDSSQFTVGQKVAIDLNNDGVVTSGGTETNSGSGFTVSAAPTSTTLTLGTAATVTVAGGRVIIYDATITPAATNLQFQSNTLINHNVEPVVTVASVSGTAGSTSQSIADFNIAATGTRDLIINALQVKTSGSYLAPVTSVAANSDPCTTSGVITVSQKTTVPVDLYQVIVTTGNTASDTVTVKSGSGTTTLETFTGVNTTSKTAIIALTSKYVTIADGSTTCSGGVPAGTIILTAGTNSAGLYDMQLWQNGQAKTVSFFVNDGTDNILANAPTARIASGSVVTFLLSSPITISRGSSTDFVVKANTSAVRTGATTTNPLTYQLYLDGQAGKGQWLGASAAIDSTQTLGGVRWDYTDVNGKYGSTGTTTAGTFATTTSGQATILNVSTGNQVMDVTDYYPVTGQLNQY